MTTAKTRSNGWKAAVAMMAAALVCRPGVAGAIDVVRPVLVVYVVENPPLTKDRPTIGEAVVLPELTKRGYKILPSLRVANLDQMCPRDVRGVWNTDRRLSFRRHFNADILWMANVEYKPDKTSSRGRVVGRVTVVARAFSADTGQSLWFGQPIDHDLVGTTLDDAARQALGAILPAMVAEFTQAPEVKAWVPAEAPQPWPRDIPLITGTPGRVPPQAPPGSSEPYTGIIVYADHLRVQPSYRTGLYSPRGQRVYVPEGRRISWADSSVAARQQAGRHPLHVKALATDGNRILLPESDALRLRNERQLLERGRVTIVVRPPSR